MASRSQPTPKKTGPVADDEDDETQVTTHIVVPPDGGWGWVVMISAFFCNFVCDGVIYNFGVVYMQPMCAEFQVSPAAVSLVGSLVQASAQFIGPVASALVNRHAFPKVLILGTVISTVGFVASYYATSITFLYFTFGVLGGCGFGIAYVVATIVVSFYFQRWRSIATCFALCGSTIGGMAGGPLLQLVVDQYDWRAAILAQAVAIGLCSFLGLTFRPLKPVQLHKQADGAGAVSQGGSLISVVPSRLGPKNHEYPSAAQVMLSETTLALLGAGTTTVSQAVSIESLMPSGRLSASMASVRVVAGPRHYVDMHHMMTGRRQRWWHCRCCWGVRWCGRKREHDYGARPLYRDDIFYGESVTRLPEYSAAGHIGYNMAVSRVATRKDVEQERSRRFIVCPEAVKRTLATMLDLSLFRSPSFMLYTAVNCLMQFALLVPFVFLPDRAQGVPSISKDSVALLVPMMSLSGFVARLTLGVVTSFPRVPLVAVSYTILTLGGVAVIAMGYTTTAWAQLTCCAVFGVALATFYSFRSLLLVQLLGLNKLTNAFGLLLLFSGCFSVLGSPLSGLVKDATDSYDYVFYLAGALIVLSGVLMIPMECVNRREKAARGQQI